ncbi:MAG TPA: AI-2E family transporter [Dokdonella sp.]|nr:AI-2E family transporter [Dokdonella sp.]
MSAEPAAVAAGAEEPAVEVRATVEVAPEVLHTRLLGMLVALLAAYTCAVAEAMIVPILVAILLGLMFAPLVRALERWHVPRSLGSLLAVAVALALGVGAFALLAAPAREWIARMPRALVHVESVLRDLRRPLQAASEATRELGKLASIDGHESMRVVDSTPGLLSQIASAAPTLLAGITVAVFLTFLFLLHGDALLRKFVALAPHLRAKRDLVEATRLAQHELSLYMITITLINAALGLATALALYLLGIPDPLLWGGLAALMNFAPFIGPLLTACALVVAGFAEFASPLSALAAPAAFLGLHLVEGQLITPHLVGRRLALDPVMVFLALVVLGWIWGVAGLLLAVPLMACTKIIAERTPGGRVVATLLSR